MGNSQTHDSPTASQHSKKKRSPSSFKTQFTRNSTYRSYLGHDEVSTGALATSREILYASDENGAQVINEKAVDVPPDIGHPHKYANSPGFVPDITVETPHGTSVPANIDSSNNNETKRDTTPQRKGENNSATSINISDYCIISRKDVVVENLEVENPIILDEGSTSTKRKFPSRLRKIFSSRGKKSSAKRESKKELESSGSAVSKSTAELGMTSSYLKESAASSTRMTTAGMVRQGLRKGMSLPGPKDLRDISGLFEDSFWWDSEGTALDENNNAPPKKVESAYDDYADSPDMTGPCPSALDTLGWETWRNNNALAVVDGLNGRQYTYRDLEEAARRVAAGLARSGVEKGGSVYVVTHNCPEVIIIFLATLTLGGTTIMADPNVSHSTMTSQLIAFEPNVVITDMEHIDAAVRIALFNSKLKIFVLGSSKKCQSFKRLLEENVDDVCNDVMSRSSDVILHVTCWDVLRNTKRYSTRLTNRNIVKNIEQIKSLGLMNWLSVQAPSSTTSAHGCCDRCGADVDSSGVARRRSQERAAISCGDIILGVVPFYHPFGLISIVFWSLMQQCTVVTLPHWEMRLVQNVCFMQGVTVLPVLSNWTSVMTTHPVVKKSGRLPKEVIIISNAIFPNWRPAEKLWRSGVKKLTFVYTLAECTGVIAAISACPATIVEKKAGLIPTASTVKIVDPTGNPLEPEVKGEIYIRGAHVMECIHNQAAEKIGLLEHGWLRTGDSGMLTKDGHLMMLGHVNDVIRFQGVTVSLRAIEEVIGRHPAVSEACVVASWALGAHVIRRPGFSDVTTKDILDYANDFMPVKCQLNYVEFVESLPLTASGRIVRRLVRPRRRLSHRPKSPSDVCYPRTADHQVLI